MANRTRNRLQLGRERDRCRVRGGAALTLDEFALWLNLEDAYWTGPGRVSIDAVVIFASLLSVGIWGGPFLREVTVGLFKRKPAGQ